MPDLSQRGKFIPYLWLEAPSLLILCTYICHPTNTEISYNLLSYDFPDKAFHSFIIILTRAKSSVLSVK
jgi:hypothetical protein